MTRGFSEIMNREIIKEFRWHGHSYVWNDEDRVYYNYENNEDYLIDVPNDAY